MAQDPAVPAPRSHFGGALIRWRACSGKSLTQLADCILKSDEGKGMLMIPGQPMSLEQLTTELSRLEAGEAWTLSLAARSQLVASCKASCICVDDCDTPECEADLFAAVARDALTEEWPDFPDWVIGSSSKV